MGIDAWIIIAYFAVTILIGLAFTGKAGESIDEYFLGGRSIPWYILGITGMATFIDISGTAFQVAFFYLAGAKGFWYCFLGAMPLVLAFLMVYIGKWLTRSGAMTNAEWMTFRFGTCNQGKLARILSAASITIVVIAFLGYFYVGAVKVLPMYIPDGIMNLLPESNKDHWVATIFMVTVMIYTVAAGFHGVVYTDLMQAILILGLIIYIAWRAFTIGTPDYYATTNTPADWQQLIPENWNLSFRTGTPESYTKLSDLGTYLPFWIASALLWGFATPFESWTSQRYYAAKNERESSLIAWWWIILYGLRFLMMVGFGVLALQIASSIKDPDQALPLVVNELVSPGIRGLLLAALLAAAMSTVAGFINASAAYFVRDIYQEVISPKAGQKELVRVSYAASALVTILGIFIGWTLTSIGDIWGWICMGLFTGMVVPNILKWFWWRFNGIGYAGGMISGIVVSIVYKLMKFEYPDYYMMLIVAGASAIGTLISVFIGKPTDMNVLVNFYKKTRPFGAWGPVKAQCDAKLVAEANLENRRDLAMILPACIWQVSLYWVFAAIVIKQFTSMWIAIGIVGITSLVLYKYWYLHLKREPVSH